MYYKWIVVNQDHQDSLDLTIKYENESSDKMKKSLKNKLILKTFTTLRNLTIEQPDL